MGRYNGKIALVTGASSGIGAALAKEFARQGADVVLTARRKERLEALAKEIEGMGRRALAIACDVNKDDDLKNAVVQTNEVLGKIDVVVANAGFGVEGRAETLTVEDYKRQNETNLYGVLRTFYATLDDLSATKGRFAVVGSVMGPLSLPGSTAYAISKYAVRALCEGLYLELRGDGISVTHISPGFIATEIRKVNNFAEYKEGRKDPAPAWMTMPADKAAKIIANGIYKRKREQVVTFHRQTRAFGCASTPPGSTGRSCAWALSKAHETSAPSKKMPPNKRHPRNLRER